MKSRLEKPTVDGDVYDVTDIEINNKMRELDDMIMFNRYDKGERLESVIVKREYGLKLG